jgi:xanthine dehydrogenase accessory factor
MPREGVFAVVLEGGTIHRGDEMELIPANLYRTLRDREPNSSCILATGLDGSVSGLRTLWLDDIPRWTNDSHGILSSYEEEIKKAEGSRILEVEAGRIFCEKIGGRKDLVICGAGHVSIPIIQLARQLGFYVTVIEDRPFFADNARRAGADQVICDNFLHGMEQVEGSPDTYFVIVTRGHRYDQDCLRKALTKPNAYIGMMGSKKRVALVKKQLEEEGFSREGLERVHTPIGLAIGAETPEEIAVSILAEIIQEKNVRKRISGYDKELLSGLTSGEGGILCTIVSRKGSAPRQIGTKMLIKRDGTITGTIGGGCAESNVIQKGLHMLRSNQTEPALELVDMTGREAEEAGMVCGGTILVYMETIPQETGGNKT